MSGITQQQTSSNGGETLDTFSNPAPMDSPVDVNSQGQGLDTFENMEVQEPEQEANEPKEEIKTEEAPKTEDSPVQTLSDSEDSNEEDSKGDEEGKSDSDGEEKVESKTEENPKTDGEGNVDEKPKGPTIRVKEGDRAVDLSPEATVPVKVDGKKQFVPLNELREAYSSKEVREREFGKLQEEKGTFKQEKEIFTQNREVIAGHMKQIGSLLEKGMRGEGNPIEPLRYLVERSGANVVDFEKQLMNYMSEEMEVYNDMDDVERQLYWKEKENEYLKNNQATLDKQREQIKAQEERSQKTLQTREKYGVSGEQYDKAKAELAELGYEIEKAEPEAICKYVALQPHAEKAEGLCEQFSEDLGDNEMDELVREVTNTLYENPNVSDKQAIKFAAAKLGYEVEDVEEEVNQLNDKVIPREEPKGNAGKVAAKDSPNHVESFDDFDEMHYGR